MSTAHYYTVKEENGDITVDYSSSTNNYTISVTGSSSPFHMLFVVRQEAQDLITALQKVLDAVEREEAAE